MISRLSNAPSLQGSSQIKTGRLCSKEPFVDFELDRSRASRRRYRVLSSTRKIAGLFHHDTKDCQRLH